MERGKRDIKKSKMQLRVRLALAVFLVIVVSAIIILVPMQADIRADAEKTLMEMSSYVSSSVSRAIDLPASFLGNSASNITFYLSNGNVSREDFVEHTRTLVYETPFICSFRFIFEEGVFDNNAAGYAGTEYGGEENGRLFHGILRRESDGSVTHTNLSSPEMFETLLYTTTMPEPKVQLLSPYRELALPDETPYKIMISAPLISSAGEYLGIVAVDVSMDALHDLVSGYKIFNNGYVVVVADEMIVRTPNQRNLLRNRLLYGADYARSPNRGVFAVPRVTSTFNSVRNMNYTTPVGFEFVSGTYYITVAAPLSEINAEGNRKILIFLISVVFAAALMAALIFFLTTFIGRRLEETKKGLKQRDKLLQTVNKTAMMLLKDDDSNDEGIAAPIRDIMKLIGTSVAVDRVYLWRARATPEKALLIREYGWVNDFGKLRESLPKVISDSKEEDQQGWKNSFMRGDLLNVRESNMSQTDQKFFANSSVKSIAMVPLSLDDHLWGYISIDNCSQERDYTEDEITILRSVGLMMVSAINRRAVHEAEIAQGRAEAAREAIMEGINYASKIQRSLLPKNSVFREAFSDHSIIWKPRDVVGGDIYWAKNFEDGTVLCVADCTGHGTPGALLTMLVVSALEATINERRHTDTAEILYMLDQGLASVLNVQYDGSVSMDINDGCDLAILFIAKNGDITMSAGNINVFVCDGKEVIRHKGQKIFVGEGRLSRKDEVNIINIPHNADNKFYIASDGLSDQIGGERRKQFGYRIFERIILENHHEKQAVISDRIWDAFEEHQGEQPRRDDFELITFRP